MTYVLFIAILNLGLGVTAAVLLNRFGGQPVRGRHRRLKTQPVAQQGGTAETRRSGSVAAERQRIEAESAPQPISVPDEWRDLLGTTSYFDAVEPSARLLQYGASAGLSKAIEMDDLVTRLEDETEEGPCVRLVSDIRLILDDLQRHSQSVLDLFDEAGYQFGPLTPHAVRLESLIQTSNEDWKEFVARLENSERADEGRNRAVGRLCHDLFSRLHAFRDEMDEIAVAAIVGGNRTDSVVEVDRTGGKPEFEGRLALEIAIADWLKNDTTRTRLASVVLVDLNDINRFNREYGLEMTDRLLSEVARVVFNGIRNNRGFDRFFRISGQQFVIFLGDTGAKNAASAAERIRQSLTQVTFRMRNQPAEVRCTAAVTGLQATDTCEHVLERLLRAIRKAKRVECETTVVVQDGKSTTAEHKLYQFAPQTVEI